MKSSGSFNIPREVLEEANKTSANEAEAILEDFKKNKNQRVREKKEEPKKEEDTPLTEEEIVAANEKRLDELIKDVLVNLNVEFTMDELMSFIMEPSTTKPNIEIFINGMYATFKGALTVDELDEIQMKMKKEADRRETTTIGYKDRHTRHLVSYALLELGKADNIKSIGNTPEERYKEIGSMNSFLIETIVKKWNLFIFATTEMTKKGEIIKK